MKFTELNLNKDLQTGIVASKYTELTAIQEQAIPVILENKDIIIQAPTGTGKTCSFVVPTLQNIDANNENVQILVLCPTRELVSQTTNEYRNISQFLNNIRSLSVYGGQDIRKQIQMLRQKPKIIISTPGRLLDLLRRKAIDISKVSVVVLDEADEMFDMGFEKDIDAILSKLTTKHQTILLSATIPPKILRISAKYQDSPISVKAQINNKDLPEIDQYYVSIKERNKFDGLVELLKSKNFYLALIFANTKIKTDHISKKLRQLDFTVDCIHSDLKQRVRDKVMQKFRNGEIQILVATDVIARGIDVNNIQAVINYDMPEDLDFYIHRIGRTARNNNIGASYTFISRNLTSEVKAIERVTNGKLKELKLEASSLETSSDDFSPRSRSNYRRDDSGGDRRDSRSRSGGNYRSSSRDSNRSSSRDSNREPSGYRSNKDSFFTSENRSTQSGYRGGDKSDDRGSDFRRERSSSYSRDDNRSSGSDSRRERPSYSRDDNRSGGNDFRRERSSSYSRDGNRSSGSGSRRERSSSYSRDDSRGPKKVYDNSNRYFINVGKMDGLKNEKNLTDFITEKLGFEPKDLKNPKVLSSFSFVEVGENVGEKIMDLKKHEINNRKINVQKTRD